MHPTLPAHPTLDGSPNRPVEALALGPVRALLHKLLPAKTVDFHVLPLLGDASDRRYYRLQLMAPADGISSLVLMCLAQPYAEGELPFVNVQRYLAAKGVPVPRIFCDDAAHGFVLLEDVGDVTLEAALQGASQDRIFQWYREALDILLTLQNPDAPIPRESCIAFHLAFDVDKLMGELDFFVTHMLKGLCGRLLMPAAEAALRGEFLKLTSVLASQPRVLTHRDYHSRNLMCQEGRVRVIDFQDARLGPCQYDLASLLCDSYVVLPSELREQLLRYYLARKAEAVQHPIERAEFVRLFDYMCLQRNLKALGTFAFQTVVKGNPRYLAAILPTLGYVQENLARHPEWRGLRDLLEEHLFAPCQRRW
ncbi:MAG: phosphotransferase [Nitrospinae bacterium]|nr:phosphotransferase [Nitrospinota bacterium]